MPSWRRRAFFSWPQRLGMALLELAADRHEGVEDGEHGQARVSPVVAVDRPGDGQFKLGRLWRVFGDAGHVWVPSVSGSVSWLLRGWPPAGRGEPILSGQARF